jgi:eukaryotic-like serine/threonine-protein kinase
MSGTLEGMLLDGQYRMGTVIGRGGMSVVYEAEDLRLARRVAIKVLRGDHSELAAERLFREAKAAARAEHPAVVTVFGYGSDETCGIDYLVMERLRGEDLATRITRNGRLAAPIATELGVEIADALAHVHAAGVLHRDLKPENIFLADRGLRAEEIKLLDFGVAKHLDMQTLTEPGQLVGTLRYMAPEQLNGMKHVDARCDVYSLGVVLYECLAGRPPYPSGNPLQLAGFIVTGQTAPLRDLQLDLPAPLCAVVERCLQLRPTDRYGSARQVCSALIEARSRQ